MNTLSVTLPAAPALPAYGVFAALLAAAGLPIYIHAPKVYVDEYGVSLAALGAVLFGLRLFDVIQDPLLGRLAGALRHQRALAVAGGVALMVASMLGLFAVTPPVAPLIWFAAAARRLPLKTVGLIQYIAPTGQFLLGLWLFGERLTVAGGLTFLLVWLGVGLYCHDLLVRTTPPREVPP